MILRQVRRTTATIVGLVACVASLLWIYFSDVTMQVEAQWLFATLCPLVAGGLAMIASYTLGNAESKAWLPLDLVSTAISTIFILTFPNAVNNKVYAKALKKAYLNIFDAASIKVSAFHYVCLIAGFVMFGVCVAATIIDIVLYFSLDKAKVNKLNESGTVKNS